ncbi:hypothetical protein GDO86_006274 [Hymenochirus boettgeri]|uniref:Cell cycle progression protein 1 n=1 Tax=Hymenochirus boettgeri TaxID=247094 RepID=A0A8T2JDB7_9PIPI|nr:hypothetical protein GDO86_006274 [Hymenochirus boettgeri]
MSENSSDSESSCGWTIINHEGSDIETLQSQTEEPYYDLASILQYENKKMNSDVSKHTDAVQELPYRLEEQLSNCASEDILCPVENTHLYEETRTISEISSNYNISTQENIQPNEFYSQVEEDALVYSQCEAASDDSDIVTLEAEIVGVLEEDQSIEELVKDSGDINVRSSFNNQFTYSHQETVLSSQHSEDESSNDEASDNSSPTLRRRVSKRLGTSGCESETKPPATTPVSTEPRILFRFGIALNKCVVLALVVAVSMGFGHFYGTVQIRERQKHSEKIHENEINDMMDDLFQCQKDQEVTLEQKELFEQLTDDLEERHDMVLSLKGIMDKVSKENQLLRQKHTELKLEADDLTASLKSSEVEKANLVMENQHLQESVNKEELAFLSLQEELMKLREQIKNLEAKGRGEIMLSENQKIRAHLIEERQKVRSFRAQKENLLTEAQILRRDLDNERQITEILKAKLEEISRKEPSCKAECSGKGNQEIEHLRQRLYDLETKLNFEQQRSDLWERLYVEAKEQNEKLEPGNIYIPPERDQSKNDKVKGKQKKKAKDSFFSSVKDTFDAMKNSTKEFVRHHKEKINQAKEAVKENLKKFSDSVKTTFRHFKDSTKTMFDKNRYKKYTGRSEEAKEANTVRREYKSNSQDFNPKKATASHYDYKYMQNTPCFSAFEDQNEKESESDRKYNSQCYNKKHCSGVFECAHQESISPVRVEEFNKLIQIYVQKQVGNFRHWKELEKFINRFFQNGVFIHDQMLFTDFVNDVEDYLEDMKEYQTNNGGVFEDFDEFIYRHFFGNTHSTTYGPSRPVKKTLQKDADIQRYKKQEQKNPHYRYRREGKWQNHECANGRHMVNLEIELGHLPFDPKY